MTELDWRRINYDNWESRVPIHSGPSGYDLQAFNKPTYISNPVRYDLRRLPLLTDHDVIHLQCHVGTDTVSLSRIGAASVTGIDFSPSALQVATNLARIAQAKAVRFVRADIYDTKQAVRDRRYDLVYTGLGSLCWLPNISRWARTVASLLRPGGELFVREMHPILWTMSPRDDGLLVVSNPYFEGHAVQSTAVTSYCGRGPVPSPERVLFNHGLSEIFCALAEAKFQVLLFEEHREAPWQALGDAMKPSEEFAGEYVLRSEAHRLPLTYTIRARYVA